MGRLSGHCSLEPSASPSVDWFIAPSFAFSVGTRNKESSWADKLGCFIVLDLAQGAAESRWVWDGNSCPGKEGAWRWESSPRGNVLFPGSSPLPLGLYTWTIGGFFTKSIGNDMMPGLSLSAPVAPAWNFTIRTQSGKSSTGHRSLRFGLAWAYGCLRIQRAFFSANKGQPSLVQWQNGFCCYPFRRLLCSEGASEYG